MFEKLEIFRMAQAMAVHASARQSLIAENVAQADTPGYKARDIASFAEMYRDQTKPQILRTTRPGHFGAAPPLQFSESLAVMSDGNESPNGNTVSLEAEMVKAADVRQENDMAIAIYKSALGILRTSLGRR